MSDRPVRLCDSCGGVDDHPRHVYATGPDDGKSDPAVIEKALSKVKDDAVRRDLFAHALDNTTVTKHLDCCREDGCPDGTCNEVTRGAEDLRGADLVKHLTTRSA